MPNNYIQLTQQTPLSAGLQQSINVFSTLLSRLQQFKLDMDNMTDGVTFSTLEQAYGIPSGKGQTVYNLLAGAVADLNASTSLSNLQAWLAAIR